MTLFLKQSTAVDVLIGPFVDLTDAATAETGESPSVKLSKNGQALAVKNDATTPTHDADGYYNCELDAADTNTVGALVLTVAASASALPIRHEFQVIEEATYDFLYASGATPIADINAECDTAISDAALATAAALATVDTNVDSILADTGTDGVVLTSAERNSIADALLDRDMSTGSDSGSATIRTVRQALRFLRNKWSISGSTLTVTKEDDTTTSWTGTLTTDSGADPVTGQDPASS